MKDKIKVGDTIYERDWSDFLGNSYFEKVVTKIVSVTDGLVETYEAGISDPSNRSKVESIHGLYVKDENGDLVLCTGVVDFDRQPQLTKSIMSKADFAKTAWNMSYEEYQKCYCPDCDKRDTCVHSRAFRRFPKVDGGLGLCPNLLKEGVNS